ncbi:MAG: exodeoxyribonuclease VII large subunit [Planctomycetaceae bacterium]
MVGEAPLTISELTAGIKATVEDQFPNVWVVGEVSNCTRASSGHIYLTLKDDQAQIRAVMWRSRASRLKFEIHDGLEIVVSGPVEVYAARGSYQLIIEQAQPRGIGALELAFQQLQKKLAAEGLFNPERKRPLPTFPERIVLITSPTGAAVRDFLQVITRRWRAVDVVLLPVAVQGDGAAGEIAQALATVPRIPNVDVVVMGRGGGSLEDLWAFNEEIVARAIAACPVPVVSAVGHEIDVSISDLVADRRALTPSEAGELVVPDQRDIIRLLNDAYNRIRSALRQAADQARNRLNAIASRRPFTHPLQMIHDRTALLDDFAERMQRGITQLVNHGRQQLEKNAAKLEALNPLRVLARGYSLTRDEASGKILHSAAGLKPGMRVQTILSSGRMTSEIIDVEPEWKLPAVSKPESKDL